MASNTKIADVKLTAFQQMVSSCTGAIITSIFVTPLDVVKIRLQAQQKPQAFTKGHCYNYCNGLMDHTCVCINGNDAIKMPTFQLKQHLKQQWYKRPGNFNGTADAFIKIARNEGITSLWSGLPPTLVMAVPATVVYFTTYEQVKGWLGFTYGSQTTDWWKPLMAGGSARVFAVTVISPLEFIRTKMQSEQSTYTRLWESVRTMVRQEGPASLWRGWGPTILRDVPFSALYWGVYETLKSRVLRDQGRDKLSFAESFLAGAMAGSVAGVFTLPFDVIKTHRQIELGEVVFAHKKKEVQSTWKLIYNLYQRNGIGALFFRFNSQTDESGPSLCHYDQHI
ncbi:probable mitochondrial glutathione transporter SLC25A40 isoform X2 [Dreissena polymorpha]|uniref:probable mitochondrial glutathione transporter SLC25A40 isoform X2 n=1 Tax=Dreissena polymorpha TaxID=45954 RepID=UPI0022643CD2|nr:probable mitochondrial glutathione transporter SLC25A40 isoform X2 [Dreissena polymorpha]